jgi:hypothetical protein
MTELLRHVIAQIEKLPAQDQDAIAARLLAEIDDERTWEERFRATTEAQWDAIAAMARSESATCQTLPLDEQFPPGGA